MKKVAKDEITSQQFTCIITGTIFGIGVLSLPARLADIARQDGWISAAIGGVYPMYIVLLTIFIARRFPEDNILSVSKKVFGKYVGSILNLMFSAQIFVSLIGLTAGIIGLSKLYIVNFLSILKISIVVLSLAVYGTYLGLKVIGRISELMYYLTIILLVIPLIAFKEGSILNICPVFGSGVNNVLRASVDSAFSYSGIEVILLIYPNVKDKKLLEGAALKSIFVIIAIYTYLTFVTIYFAGPYIITRSYFPVMLLNESINLPFINSFRFIFMLMWIMIVFKTIINFYYACIYSISNSIVKFNIEKVNLIVCLLIAFVVNNIGNEGVRRAFIRSTIYYDVGYNIIFVTLTAIIIFFKKGERNENI